MIGKAVIGALLASTGLAQKSWVMTWSDEFNGTTIDQNKWHFEEGNGYKGWGNNELEYYTNRP
jgi:beta-glucanase (GH16 family)